MGGSSVRVKGFSRTTTELDLRQFFNGYGRVTNVHFTSGIQAIVKFDDSRDAENAVNELNGKQILRRRVTVDKRVLMRTNFRLIVKNLPTRVSWQDLKDYMRKAGEVTYGNAHQLYPNEGIVEFASYRDMLSAIEMLDDSELNGERIRLVKHVRLNKDRSIHCSRSRFRNFTRSQRSDRSRSRCSTPHSSSPPSENSHGGSHSSSRSTPISPSGSRSSIVVQDHEHGSCNQSETSSRFQPNSRSSSLADNASTVSKKSSVVSDQSRSRSRSPLSCENAVSQQVLDSMDVNKTECPNCFSFMNPAIPPCGESHCFCSDCPCYISKCEVCRGVVAKSLVVSVQRGQSIETHFCRYSGQGCDYIGSGMELASHHIICRITTMECPLKFMKCSWLGKLPTMPQHCSESHPNNFYTVNKKKFLISNFVQIIDRRIDMIFNVYDTFFRCAWDLNKETGDMRIAMYHVGSPLIYTQFSFEVLIHSENENSPAITLGGQIFQMYNYNKRFVEEKYVGIKHGFMKEFCQRDGSLYFTMSILEELSECTG